jgi:hypothetical protein
MSWSGQGYISGLVNERHGGQDTVKATSLMLEHVAQGFRTSQGPQQLFLLLLWSPSYCSYCPYCLAVLLFFTVLKDTVGGPSSSGLTLQLQAILQSLLVVFL